MKKTKTLLGNKAREALMRGIDAVYAPVAASIGAQGRNTIYRTYGRNPVVTNDGVTIARNINPEKEEEAIGADLIKQAAEMTNFEAGDGTTTTVVLTREIIRLGFDAVKNGRNPMSVRRELEKSMAEAVLELKQHTRPVEDNLLQIAMISVEDEQLAKLSSEAVTEAGADGIVDVVEYDGATIEKEIVSGYFFEKGYTSPYMVTNKQKMIAELDNAAVILTDKYLNRNSELVPALEALHSAGETVVFVVCDDMGGELLQTVIANNLKGAMQIVVVKKPASTHELEDIATITGSTAITDSKGIKGIPVNCIGRAKRIIVKNDQTLILFDKNESTESRTSDMKEELSNDKDNIALKERLAKLTSGFVVIKVGAKTQADRNYIKLKLDDAVCACQAALSEGIVAGGGNTLDRISGSVSSHILAEALKAPRKKILENAGIADDGQSYDVRTGQVIENLLEAGIVDPAKVTRCCIENAVSLAASVLTTECLTYEVPQE